MKIVTYHSANAPAEISWIAYWLVPIKPSDKDADKLHPGVSKEGLMPYSFRAATEAEAITKAQNGWDTSFGKQEKHRRDVEARAASVRVRTRSAA